MLFQKFIEHKIKFNEKSFKKSHICGCGCESQIIESTWAVANTEQFKVL